MIFKKLRKCFAFILAAFFLFAAAFQIVKSQEKNRPQAFRSRYGYTAPFVLPSTLDLQLLEAFVLMQKANAGESPAQHELGLRYLLGRGFPTDTVKAAFWIQKAAAQHLPLAEFNMGILLLNGMGIEWNPFKAFENFKAAAEDENPEALYIMGLLYTENFIVPRSWPKAYRYLKKASELGSESAKSSMKEMIRRGLDTAEVTENSESEKSNNKQKKTSSSNSGFSLLFIDFHRDTVTKIEDTTLIREANEGISESSPPENNNSMQALKIDSSARSAFAVTAAAGNPEALCLLGRCYERGLNVQKDLILAGVYYLRALHLDSYRAPSLLWKLMITDEFSKELEMRASRNDPDALYVWSGLYSAGFDKLINDKQAFELLQRAAAAGHTPSMVELGLCYFTGRWTQKNVNKAVELWNRASSLGSTEAQVRLAAANVLGQIHTEDFSTAISFLRKAAKQGSLFSDLTIAYSYEKGIGLPRDKGQAYRIFRGALARGSETAYNALRSMHDEIRPPDKEFQIPD